MCIFKFLNFRAKIVIFKFNFSYPLYHFKLPNFDLTLKFMKLTQHSSKKWK